MKFTKCMIIVAVGLAMGAFAPAVTAAGQAQVAADAKPKVKKTAQQIAEEYAKLSPQEKAERRRRFMEAKMRNTGGKIVQPGSQQGSIVFYDCQSTFKPEAIDKTVKELARELQYDIRREKIDAAPTSKVVKEFLKEKGTTFGIFLVDDKDDPNTLSIFPEQKYAVINAVAVGGKDLRFQRELKRTFAMLCGASCSTYPASLLSAVVAPIDLDSFVNDDYSVDIIQRMNIYLKGYEVKPARTVTYAMAVQEGWAPQPTNEYQKAAWDRIRSIPDKPIKIEP